MITENNLQSDVIWNADETGKGFEHNPSNVVARKGAKNIPGRTGNSRENITILACVNAQGEKLPPLCVVKGKTTKSLESVATVDGPDGTLWTYQEKAWMCDILGELWFRDIFLKNCGPKRPKLLIMDSHGSHETLGLLDEAKKENIIVMALPPHTSHHLQPLDKSVFGPFSKSYDRECTEFMAEHPDHLINKATWPRIFKKAWEAGITPQNIKSGFRATGIYPLNPSAVPDSAYLPSEPFNQPMPPTASVDGLQSSAEVSVEMDEIESLDSSLNLLADAAAALSSDQQSSQITCIVDVHDELNASVNSQESDFNVPAADVESLLHVLDNGNYTLFNVEEIELDTNWNSEIEDIFAIPPATKKPKTSSSITSHRILTSDAVIQIKREKLEEKQRKEREKENRKIKAEEKKKEVKKEVKKVLKNQNMK